jgi:hypothetical protein
MWVIQRPVGRLQILYCYVSKNLISLTCWRDGANIGLSAIAAEPDLLTKFRKDDAAGEVRRDDAVGEIQAIPSNFNEVTVSFLPA